MTRKDLAQCTSAFHQLLMITRKRRVWHYSHLPLAWMSSRHLMLCQMASMCATIFLMGSDLIWMTASENSMSNKWAASAHGNLALLWQTTQYVITFLNMRVIVSSFIIYHFKYSRGFSEYLTIKKNITDEGSEKHVNDITGCKPGCNMFKYKTTLKERLRFLSTEHDQVLYI